MADERGACIDRRSQHRKVALDIDESDHELSPPNLAFHNDSTCLEKKSISLRRPLENPLSG